MIFKIIFKTLFASFVPGLYIQGAISEYKDGSQVLPTGRLRVAFDEEIYKLNIDKTPLLMLLNKIGKRSVKRMTFNWMTKERKADYVATTAVGGAWAAGAATGGTFTVSTANAYLFAEGDIVQFPAISQTINVFVESVVQATGVVTCTTVSGNLDLSGVGSSYPTALLIGNSFELGSGKGTLKSAQPSEVYNYIQIMQTPIGLTTTAQHLDYRGGEEKAEQWNEAAIDHAFKLEKTLFFGQRYRDASGRMDGIYEQFFTGGIRYYLSTNVTDASGALTESEFGNWVRDSIYYAKEPVIFAGQTVYEGLTTWAEQNLQVERTDDTLGMAVSNYLTKYGDRVKVIPHRELLTSSYAGVAFCVDLADIEYRFLEGLDTHLEVDIQNPDVKQKIDEYRTWFGLWLGNEKRHGLLYNVTSISTS